MSSTSAYGMVARRVDRFPSPMAAELRAVHGGRQAGSEVGFAVRSYRPPLFPTCLSDVLAWCATCDGGINHLHRQLFPRYPGDPIASSRFVATRQPRVGGGDIARLIRAAL